MSDIYWNIPTTNLISPVDLMQEQAAALSQATAGLLKGEIKQESGRNKEVEYALYIVVPRMNFYKYKVLDYTQDGILLYPGKVFDFFEEEFFMIENEESFRKAIRAILSSPNTGNIVSSLIAQAKTSP